MIVAYVAALTDDLDRVRPQKARRTGDARHLVARELVLQHLDLMIQRDVQAPSQIIGRDVFLVAVRAPIEATLAPAGEVEHRLAQRL